jgi:uncharacterized delta-60 repeat protein
MLHPKLNLALGLLILITVAARAQTPAGLDLSFNTTGTFIGDGGREVAAILPLTDGSVLVAQNVVANSGHSFLRKHKADGSVDVTFGINGKFDVQIASDRTKVNAIKLHNNNIFIAGETFDGSSTYCFLAKIKEDGSGYNTSFSIGGVKTTYFLSQLEDLVINNDGDMFLLGTKDFEKATIMKVLANGNTDITFGNAGRAQHSSANSNTFYWMYSLAIDQQNKLVATGKYYTYTGTPFTNACIMKVKENGNLDSSFDNDGVAYYNSANSQNNEGRKIMVSSSNNYFVGSSAPQAVGNNTDFALLKTNANGIVDNTFGTAGWKQYDLMNNGEGEYVNGGEILQDDRILLAGVTGIGDTIRFGLLMLNPDGTRNTNFASNGVYRNIFGQRNNNAVNVCAIDASGKIYLGGYARTCSNGVCGPLSAALAKYTGADFVTTVPTEHSIFQRTIYPNPCRAGSSLQIRDASDHHISGFAILTTSMGRHYTLPIANNSITLPQFYTGLCTISYQSKGDLVSTKLLVQ